MAANDEGDRSEGEATRLRARDLNELIRYTMWSVFKVTDRAALDGTGAVGEPSSRPAWPAPSGAMWSPTR